MCMMMLYSVCLLSTGCYKQFNVLDIRRLMSYNLELSNSMSQSVSLGAVVVDLLCPVMKQCLPFRVHGWSACVWASIAQTSRSAVSNGVTAVFLNLGKQKVVYI